MTRLRVISEENSVVGRSWSGALFAYLIRFDYLQLFAMLSLITVSLIFMHSTDLQTGRDFFGKQLQWVIIGLIAYVGAANIDYRHWVPLAWGAYFEALLLLLAVKIFGVTVYGAQSWLDLGGMRLQPSEFAKPAVLLFLASMLCNRLFDVNKFSHFLLYLAMAALPAGLILLEPDFGSALIFVPMAAGMVFISPLKWRRIMVIAAVVLSVFSIVAANEIFSVKPLLKEYQRERILNFLEPERDISGRGYNQYQSRLAVGSGGLWGKGIGEGTQNSLGFLPRTVSNNDFLFSVIAEETGFAGALTIVLLELLLIYCCFRTGFTTEDAFGRYIAIGAGMILLTHDFINMGMSIGLTPVTGVPLPFLSYGGSFMLAQITTMGILQSVHRHRY